MASKASSDAGGEADMRRFFASKFGMRAVQKIMGEREAKAFVERKCENMVLAWRMCGVSVRDLVREFLERPIRPFNKGTNYVDKTSVQSKWLKMLEAKRPELRSLGVDPHLLIGSTIQYLAHA